MKNLFLLLLVLCGNQAFSQHLERTCLEGDCQNGFGICRVMHDGVETILYQGNFRNNQFQGYGEAKYDDGTYKGNWVNGKREGSGKFYSNQGNLAYDGEWKNDRSVGNFVPFLIFEPYFEKCYVETRPFTAWGQAGQVTRRFCAKLNPDLSFRGSIRSEWIMADSSRSITYEISGVIDPKSLSLTLEQITAVNPPALPAGLRWRDYKGPSNLKLKREPLYYVLTGVNEDGSLANWRTED
ncbi:MAG: hypothetical protein H6581_14130 [Bacteroidia bacterium]|nr:hypothetical protein [Bacteroidia bacterium]